MENPVLQPAQPAQWAADEADQSTQHRANVYRFLSHLYLEEVSPALLGVLKRWDTREDLAQVGMDLGDLLDQADDSLLEELAVGYCSTFVVPQSAGLFPHESCHLEGRLLGECSLVLEDAYEAQRLGLREGGERREMPDHLGVELEFMARLATAEAAAEARGEDLTSIRAAQAQFLRDHLLVWVPRYAKILERDAAHPFYQRLGQLTHAFMESERQWLDGRLDT